MNTKLIMVLYRARIVAAHRAKHLRDAARAAKQAEIVEIDAQLKREVPRPPLDLFGGTNANN